MSDEAPITTGYRSGAINRVARYAQENKPIAGSGISVIPTPQGNAISVIPEAIRDDEHKWWKVTPGYSSGEAGYYVWVPPVKTEYEILYNVDFSTTPISYAEQATGNHVTGHPAGNIFIRPPSDSRNRYLALSTPKEDVRYPSLAWTSASLPRREEQWLEDEIVDHFSNSYLTLLPFYDRDTGRYIKEIGDVGKLGMSYGDTQTNRTKYFFDVKVSSQRITIQWVYCYINAGRIYLDEYETETHETVIDRF